MAGMSNEDCLFCKIVAGDVPADVVRTTDHVVAFRDINPQAPTHVLVIPRSHQANASELAAAEPETVARLVDVAARWRRRTAWRTTGWCSTPGRGSGRPCSTPTCTSSADGR